MGKKDKKAQKPRAWKNVGTFSSYEDADQKRKKLLQNDDINAKVKRMADGKFIVKLRQKELPKKKQDKKPKS